MRLQLLISTNVFLFFGDTELLLVSVSHPKFKTSWIDDPELKQRCSMLLLNAVQIVSAECTAAPV